MLHYTPHGDHGVQVTPHPLGVLGEEVGFGGGQSHVQTDGLHGRVDLIQLIKPVDVGHVTSIQDVVDVLKERLTFDLWKINVKRFYILNTNNINAKILNHTKITAGNN